MQTITIETGNPYPVHIGRGLLARAGALIAQAQEPCAAALIADESVANLYAQPVAQSLQDAGFAVSAYRFTPGEASKSMEELNRLLEFLAQREMGRGDLIVALGGGVAGDLAGFAAAVYQRGMAFAQIPTTLLAAVDSSVGGKTAVNLPSGKNLVGAFWQPTCVLCDCDAFGSLPQAELSAGAAECVKYAVLGDPGLLQTLTRHGLYAPWEAVTELCVRRKADVVARDEREMGIRQLLNLGHTVGHAAERLSGYTLRHGEGVAMGMMVITRAAERMELCEAGTSQAIAGALRALHLPMECPYPPEALAQAALGDKKRRGNAITLVMPRRIGECALQTVQTDALETIFRLGWEA